LIISGSDNYSGGTYVTAGTLILAANTALPGDSNVTVAAGAILLFDATQAVAAPLGRSAASPANPVPEPGTLLLLAAALGLGGCAWHRKATSCEGLVFMAPTGFSRRDPLQKLATVEGEYEGEYDCKTGRQQAQWMEAASCFLGDDANGTFLDCDRYRRRAGRQDGLVCRSAHPNRRRTVALRGIQERF
jgi:autotransporter-associated beta strand protein